MFSTAFQANAFQNDAFQITITPVNPTKMGGDDASWTLEERRRYKALQKKLRLAEEKRLKAVKDDADKRKQTITDLIDPPVVKTQQQSKNKVQSNQEVSVDIPSNLALIDQYIANLVKQQQDLFNAVQLRQAKILLEQEMAILEAKRLQELDDEEALLALIL